MVELMIFVIELTLLQNYTHFTTPDKHFIKTHKYYNFLHLRRDGSTTGPRNFPQNSDAICPLLMDFNVM